MLQDEITLGCVNSHRMITIHFFGTIGWRGDSPVSILSDVLQKFLKLGCLELRVHTREFLVGVEVIEVLRLEHDVHGSCDVIVQLLLSWCQLLVEVRLQVRILLILLIHRLLTFLHVFKQSAVL